MLMCVMPLCMALRKVIDTLQLHTLLLINMGAILDLPSEDWFRGFSSRLSVHVIDSSRPQNLSSLFGGGENGERIVIWDDGGAERLEDERKAWEVLTVSTTLISHGNDRLKRV